MDVLAFITSLFEPPWRYVLGGLVLMVLLAPRLIELRASWLSLRIGLRELDIERRKQELLKLKYEIEALRKQHDLPAIGLAASPVPSEVAATALPRVAPRPSQSKPVAEPIQPSSNPIVKWLLGHPMIGKPLFWSLQVLLGFLGAMFGTAAVVMPIMGFTTQDVGISKSAAIVGFVLYGLLTWGVVVLYIRVRRWRKQGASAPSDPPLPHIVAPSP